MPKDLDKYEHQDIMQGYLDVKGQEETRVRKQGSVYTLTVKRVIAEDRREEVEEYITEEQFNDSWQKTAGKRIVKVRYKIPYNGLIIELDKFKDNNDGLIIAEVEFDEEEKLKKFRKPDWFGMDVTTNSKYKNANLAK